MPNLLSQIKAIEFERHDLVRLVLRAKHTTKKKIVQAKHLFPTKPFFANMFGTFISSSH
jgi:hypothetical protein